MKTNEFKKLVNEAIENIEWGNLEPMTETKKEFVSKFGAMAIFSYSRWCEINFERNLREDYERKTTFTADFSIAEWCEQVEKGAILDTYKRAINEWYDNIEYFAELMLAMAMKSWEHDARGNVNLSCLYSDLYLITKDLYFTWFDESHPKCKEAGKYYFDYVD